MTERFVYVILHYGAYEETVKAIDSVLGLSAEKSKKENRIEKNEIEKNNSQIVVVDNASPDGSGKRLVERYGGTQDVHILLNHANEGFARGNNFGYDFARRELAGEFIVVMNNDVEILQGNFEQIVRQIYRESPFHVLGPDIVTAEGERRNPHRKKPFTIADINRIIRNRTIILWYLKIKQAFRIENKIHWLEDWDRRRVCRERSDLQAQRESRQSGVVLHGSFLVFSPAFVMREERAFCPDTFMYMEEEILSYLCNGKGYEMLYTPEIQVLHKEEVSTAQSRNAFQKYLFYTQHLRESARVMKGVLSG